MGLVYEILQTLIEGIAIENSRGRLAFANTALERLLGYQQDDLLGVPWRTLFCEGSRVKDAERQVGESSQSVNCCEAALRHRDGGRIPVLVSSRRLPAGDGEEVILSTFSVLQASEAHKAEFRQMREIDVASQQGSSIVHELNNSLAIIVLQSRLLANRGPMSRQYGEGLSVIHDQAQRMMQMVDRLRFSEDPFEPRMQTVQVNELLRQTLDILHPQCLFLGLEVVTDLAPGLPTTRADPNQLQQVFVNVINNALQAMTATSRGGRLVVASSLCRSTGQGGPKIQIQFADNGPGIPQDVKPLIFEPFFTTKKQGQSMGLGLSICSQIVHRHQGTIRVQDNEEGGATFVLELPVAEAEEGSAMQSPDRWRRDCWLAGTADLLTQGQHILVIDDEPAVADSTRQVLEHAGFHVTVACEAKQALSLVDEADIDLIVSDFTMPQMNGQEFWETVTERHPHLARRIIFSTGDSSSQRARAFLRERGCTWIAKPFQATELVHLIREALPGEQDIEPSRE